MLKKKFDKVIISGENRELFKKYLLKNKIDENKIEILQNENILMK